jgi:hypothetical protein
VARRPGQLRPLATIRPLAGEHAEERVTSAAGRPRTGWRRARSLAVALLVVGCGSSPGLSAVPSFQPVHLATGAAGVVRATLTGPLIPRVGDRPDGPQFLSEPDGIPQPLEAGRRVVILGDPQPGPEGPWVRVWVEMSITTWPGDFYAWLPDNRPNRTFLESIPPATCPAEATIETLAPLVQQDRLRCAAGAELTIDARTGEATTAALYDVDPAWYGRNQDNGTTLFDPGPARFGPDATRNPQEAGSWIDARVPPAVPPLPIGFYLRVSGHFDDPTAAGCRRAIPNAVPGRGAPPEAAADSVQWCREQFVVTGWEALLGPEGRPIDPLQPQLHRREFRLEPGVQSACGGVGMQRLTVRIDPAQIDPVWVESGPNRFRSQAMFSDEFRLVLNPPRVQSTTGVTLVDGEQLDPDAGKPGLALCPGGATIWFDLERM